MHLSKCIAPEQIPQISKAPNAKVTELFVVGATHFQSALHLSVQNHFVKDAPND
jgi:hypothetical protein